jgi:hypothetical protein
MCALSYRGDDFMTNAYKETSNCTLYLVLVVMGFELRSLWALPLEHVPSHQIVHCENVHFLVYQVYLNDAF